MLNIDMLNIDMHRYAKHSLPQWVVVVGMKWVSLKDGEHNEWYKCLLLL